MTPVAGDKDAFHEPLLYVGAAPTGTTPTAPGSVHVGDLDATKGKAGKGWKTTVTIAIRDAGEATACRTGDARWRNTGAGV